MRPEMEHLPWDLDLGTVDFRDHPRRSELPVANQFAVALYFPKALVPLHPHTHPYGHVTWVTGGRVAVRCGDEVKILDPSNPLSIGAAVPPDVVHQAMGLDDGATAMCVHILRDSQGVEYPFSYKLTTAEMLAATGRA